MFYKFKDYDDGTIDVFDSSDFSVERVKISDLGDIEVYDLHNHHIDKYILYKNDDFCLIIEQAYPYEYQCNLIVRDKLGKIVYSFGYNKYIKKPNDFVKPSVKPLDGSLDMLQVDFFGEELGFSIVLAIINKRVVKPVYRDHKYVKKGTTLKFINNTIRRI